MKTKNNAIEFYRIIATLIICIHHAQNLNHLTILSNGFLMVEFFFILSGLFLAQKFDCESYHSGSKYFFGRIKRLYPEYIVATVIAIASYAFVDKFDISKSISEIFMVQDIGMFFGGYNYPCWYISTIVFAGIILYEALRYGRNLFVKVIAPITVILGYTYIAHGISDGTSFVWLTQGCVHIPLLRCFCGMMTGIIIYYISKFEIIYRIKKWVWTLLEIASLTVTTIGFVTDKLKIQIIVLSMILLIFVTYTQCGYISSKILNFNIFSYIGKYSYSVYLNHGIISKIFENLIRKNLIDSGTTTLLIYILAVIVYSIITHNIISVIFRKFAGKALFNKDKS